MVIDGFQDLLTGLITASAVLAAIMGFIVLERFFHDKLEELFSDSNYFIFFFLVVGYILYSLGEVALYLTSVVMKSASFPGISDVYWVGGALFILVSFFALTIQLVRNAPSLNKLPMLLFFGLVVVSAVIGIIFTTTLGFGQHFLHYFYPLASALIVSFGFSVILFSSQLGTMSSPLTLFFIASTCILIGDIFYTSILTSNAYGIAGLAADLAYLGGYFLSFIAFLTMRWKFHTLPGKQQP